MELSDFWLAKWCQNKACHMMPFKDVSAFEGCLMIFINCIWLLIKVSLGIARYLPILLIIINLIRIFAFGKLGLIKQIIWLFKVFLILSLARLVIMSGLGGGVGSSIMS